MERALARVKKMASLEGSASNDGGGGTAASGGGVPGVSSIALALPSVPNLAPAPLTMPVCHVAFPWRGALYPVM